MGSNPIATARAAQQPAPFQILPPLSAEENASLKADIKKHGVQVPIEVDEDGTIIDGHHRAQICRELGIDCPKNVRKGMTDAEKRSLARRLNLHRRHLDQATRRKLIEAELLENPERSNRQIAAGLGVDHKTVGGARERLTATGEIPQLAKTTGRDGKARRTQPARAARGMTTLTKPGSPLRVDIVWPKELELPKDNPVAKPQPSIHDLVRSAQAEYSVIGPEFTAAFKATDPVAIKAILKHVAEKYRRAAWSIFKELKASP